MAVFSFKRRFVTPIRLGLSKVRNNLPVECEDRTIYPKRQTIRAERKDLWRPRLGMELQLYCGLRTKAAFLIGRALCTGVESIRLRFGARTDVVIGKIPLKPTSANLDKFSRDDGFADWDSLREFWRQEHEGVESFRGFITFWEPMR